jgi:hypothetical protein
VYGVQVFGQQSADAHQGVQLQRLAVAHGEAAGEGDSDWAGLPAPEAVDYPYRFEDRECPAALPVGSQQGPEESRERPPGVSRARGKAVERCREGAVSEPIQKPEEEARVQGPRMRRQGLSQFTLLIREHDLSKRVQERDCCSLPEHLRRKRWNLSLILLGELGARQVAIVESAWLCLFQLVKCIRVGTLTVVV